MNTEKPWLKYYGDVSASIDYPAITMYEAVMRTILKYPDAIAYEFLGIGQD